MESEFISNKSGKIRIPQASSAALRGRQSMRATFKLSRDCIDAITIVATHLGIKQKSLFDHLIEDLGTLEPAAGGRHGTGLDQISRVPKTFVVSRNAMDVLNAISAKTGFLKEDLIELSVQRLLPLIAREQVIHEERKKMMDQISTHLKQGEQLHRQIRKVFDQDDIVFQRYTQIMDLYKSCVADIRKYINKTRRIEKFKPGSIEP